MGVALEVRGKAGDVHLAHHRLHHLLDSRGTAFEQLLGIKEHEMHHRVQLMLIERQLGIAPHLTRQANDRIAKMRAAQPA